jgi:hypothetical protein
MLFLNLGLVFSIVLFLSSKTLICEADKGSTIILSGGGGYGMMYPMMYPMFGMHGGFSKGFSAGIGGGFGGGMGGYGYG